MIIVSLSSRPATEYAIRLFDFLNLADSLRPKAGLAVFEFNAGLPTFVDRSNHGFNDCSWVTQPLM